MTSKEALKYMYNWIYCCPFGTTYEDDIKLDEAKKIIIKDLEILEAIKDKAQNNRFYKGCLLRMFVEVKYKPKEAYFQTKQKIKDEKYELIKNWLERDSDK